MIWNRPIRLFTSFFPEIGLLHPEKPGIEVGQGALLTVLGEQAKDDILKSVCSYLQGTGYLFRCEWATLLDGRDEGLFGWVTVRARPSQ